MGEQMRFERTVTVPCDESDGVIDMVSKKEMEHRVATERSARERAEEAYNRLKLQFAAERQAQEKANARIADLEHDLRLNAYMLARQTDMARDAENERDAAKRQAAFAVWKERARTDQSEDG